MLNFSTNSTAVRGFSASSVRPPNSRGYSNVAWFFIRFLQHIPGSVQLSNSRLTRSSLTLKAWLQDSRVICLLVGGVSQTPPNHTVFDLCCIIRWQLLCFLSHANITSGSTYLMLVYNPSLVSVHTQHKSYVAGENDPAKEEVYTANGHIFVRLGAPQYTLRKRGGRRNECSERKGREWRNTGELQVT